MCAHLTPPHLYTQVCEPQEHTPRHSDTGPARDSAVVFASAHGRTGRGGEQGWLGSCLLNAALGSPGPGVPVEGTGLRMPLPHSEPA